MNFTIGYDSPDIIDRLFYSFLMIDSGTVVFYNKCRKNARFGDELDERTALPDKIQTFLVSSACAHRARPEYCCGETAIIC